MRLSVTAWSFPALTLPEVAGVARAIGITAVDLGLFYRSALDRARLLAAPETLADELLQLGSAFSNLYWLFGADMVQRNLADPTARAANRHDFVQVLRFCKAAGIPSVMLLPGMLGRGQSRHDALRESAAALRELLPLAAEAGVTIAVEPHVHSFVESPTLALELLAAAPGAKLALDYAHFVCLGYRQEEIDRWPPTPPTCICGRPAPARSRPNSPTAQSIFLLSSPRCARLATRATWRSSMFTRSTWTPATTMC